MRFHGIACWLEPTPRQSKVLAAPRKSDVVSIDDKNAGGSDPTEVHSSSSSSCKSYEVYCAPNCKRWRVVAVGGLTTSEGVSHPTPLLRSVEKWFKRGCESHEPLISKGVLTFFDQQNSLCPTLSTALLPALFVLFVCARFLRNDVWYAWDVLHHFMVLLAPRKFEVCRPARLPNTERGSAQKVAVTCLKPHAGSKLLLHETRTNAS